ncbi:MAG: hypothetical protein ACK4FJ_05930 [Ferrovibrio sp.]|uniref:hypothetical protein n=1 Tax=Ferrovibrio sp. TaxID=1917215 RepID=UPI00391AF293
MRVLLKLLLAVSVFLAAGQALAQVEPRQWVMETNALFLAKDVAAFEKAFEKAAYNPQKNAATFVNAFRPFTNAIQGFGNGNVNAILRDQDFGNAVRFIVSYVGFDEQDVYVEWRFVRDKSGWRLRGFTLQSDLDNIAPLLR